MIVCWSPFTVNSYDFVKKSFLIQLFSCMHDEMFPAISIWLCFLFAIAFAHHFIFVSFAIFIQSFQMRRIKNQKLKYMQIISQVLLIDNSLDNNLEESTKWKVIIHYIGVWCNLLPIEFFDGERKEEEEQSIECNYIYISIYMLC